jgi:hypothetical protein
LHALGFLVTVIALAFVGWSTLQLDWSGLNLGVSFPLCVAVAIYTGLVFLQGAAWWCLLQGLSPTQVPLSASLQVFARAEFYKYVPSNVVQFIGRNILANSLGVSPSAIVLSVLLESLLLISVWLLVALVAILKSYHASSPMLPSPTIIWFGSSILAIAMLGTIVFGYRHMQRHRLLHKRGLLRFILYAGASSLLFVFYVLVCGSIVVVLTQAVSPQHQELPLLLASGVLGLAWILGFITPGASAGIGIRESIIILGLQGAIGNDAAVLVSLLYRITTFGGDTLAALVGWVSWKWSRPL